MSDGWAFSATRTAGVSCDFGWQVTDQWIASFVESSCRIGGVLEAVKACLKMPTRGL